MIFEIILTFIIFFVVKAVIYYFTDIKGLPAFLCYKPWVCYKCCSFWTLLTIYPTIYYMSNFTWWYSLVVGISITGLDTIALQIEENNTISINEIEIK